ncbi:hypothetical protein ANCCEY_03446 [Ancylostoma ceylanicum]|uniref:Uncharacterized protein n=1 Tax=Ancylostoma ceylanicum TaxID=53326 RepID=A0A0D6M1W0_9BILA|nr:hypothetical protein ANCCEY_03446 [Ancylostoma ceylanicum]
MDIEQLPTAIEKRRLPAKDGHATSPTSQAFPRTSQPSTSSESENFPSKASDSTQSQRRTRETKTPRGKLDQECTLKEEGSLSMSYQRRKGHARIDDDVSSSKSSVAGDNVSKESAEPNSPAPSVSGLRRSAREPRPKRTLSPTPISPKRRARLKKPNLVLVGYDPEEIETKNVDTATSDKRVEAELPHQHEPLCGSQQSLGVASPVTSFKSLDGDSDLANDTPVADDDMENDLVDIQPFDSGDTTSEVFVSAKFTGRRNNEGSVEVSVLAIPQQVENIEHSTKFAEQQLDADSFIPSMRKEFVSDTSLQKNRSEQDEVGTLSADVHDHLSSSSEGIAQTRVVEPSASEAHIGVLDAGGENDFIGDDVASQMEPPVLEGPIIESPTSEFKPGVDVPPTLMADGVLPKPHPKPMHYVVGEIYRVHTPNGTEQEVQLALMDDGTEALVNANGDIVDMTPEDTYAAIDICDIEFNFLDDKNVVCGLCGEMLEPDMLIGDLTYVEYLKAKLENDRKNIQNGFKFAKQALFRRTPRKVSQIRINPNEMTMPQLEVALRKKLLEKMGRRVNVSLVDKEHVKCGICNSVISINKKFEIVHVIRHFNAWHPTNHQCAGQWQKRTQRPGVGKPLSKQDFAVIDLSHTQPDNLQCIWCGMFIDATTIAVHFTDCHPGEVEVPKCLLCIQELVINARVIEKFGSDFDIVLQDEFHIKVGKLNKLFTSESQMDTAIEKYLDILNGKRKRASITVERRVFEGDSMVVQTTAIPGDDDPLDELDLDSDPQPPRKTNTNSRMIFGKHNKPKRSMVQPIYRQAPPTNSEYVKVISDSHWKCKICDADLYGAVISACAIRHFKLKHPQESDSLQFEVVRARLDRISDGCMEFVHPMMLECLICHLTYQLHKPYNVCRGIRHLKSRHPEIMPEFNGEPLRRYRKTGTALRLDDDPNIPRRRRDSHLQGNNDADLLARMKAQYPNSFDKVQTIYGDSGEPMYVLMSGEGESEEITKENIKNLSSVSGAEPNEQEAQENDGQFATADVKPGREVVFELSFDYNNLDADGKPQKHLVRVTPNAEPNAPSKSTSNPNPRPSFFVQNERRNIPEPSSEQNEANEVFFGEVDHADSNSAESSTVMLGDVLFIDADGNEIIQRTTALPDGTIQQQYLGQAEDGSLFLLDDIVSAGLHPYSETVEEVYDGEIIDESAEPQEMVLQDEYENGVEGVANSRYPAVNQTDFRNRPEVLNGDSFETTIMQHPYNGNGAVVVQEGYSGGVGRQELRPQYSREVVVEDTIHYAEDEVVLNEEDYEQHMEEYCGEQEFEQSTVASEPGTAVIEDASQVVHASTRQGESNETTV